MQRNETKASHPLTQRRRQSRQNALTVSVLLAAFSASCSVAERNDDAMTLAGTRPNIIFIFSDDHATHAISAYGSQINRTPNIDRLAREGVLFSNCFCGNSICGPSRATILSGKHSHANGFTRNGNRFDPMQTTFPPMLQAAGYQTAMIGKWHLSSDPVGFDFWTVLPGQGQYYNPDFRTPQGRVRLDGYCTDITTDLALNWLKEKRDPNKPFMLMCQHKAPHRSWMPGPEELGLYRDADIPEPATLFDDYSGRGQATREQEMSIAGHLFSFYDLKLLPNETEQQGLKGPDRSWRALRDRMSIEQLAAWDDAFEPENRAFRENPPTGEDLVRWKYQRYIKNYLRCVAGVDKSVGQLLEYVDSDPKLAANTIVIYSSDQGFYLGDHGWYDKRWMYEQSLRMPLVARLPKGMAPGRDIDQLVQNIDFGPTFLDLAGVETPEEMHGQSLVPLLENGEAAEWRDAIYYHYYESHAVHQVAAHYGVRTDRYKLIHFYEPDRNYWELYDLKNDPQELVSLYDDPSFAAVRARLETRLRELRAQYRDTTGELGGGEFDVTAGIAMARERGDRWRVRANTRGGYLLKSSALNQAFKMQCSLQPVSDGGNGFVIFTGGHPRQQLFRAGVDFKRNRLVLLRGMKEIAGADILIDGSQVPIAVDVDLRAHTVQASAGGQTVTAQIPDRWDSVTAYGYGASNATTDFTPIEVTSE